MSDIADELRDLADRIENDDGKADDLPSFEGYQMVKCFGPEHAKGAVYVDTDGDIWFNTERGKETQCFGQSEDAFFEALQDARDYADNQ